MILLSLGVLVHQHTGGYLTDSGDADLARLETILRSLAPFEVELFAKRQHEEEEGTNSHHGGGGRPGGRGRRGGRGGRGGGGVRRGPREVDEFLGLSDDDDDAKELDATIGALAAGGALADPDLMRQDTFQVKYYRDKFGHEWTTDPTNKRALVRAFIEGLVWVYKYYYAGAASWKWFFPYYYAPLACDLIDLVALGPFVFDLGQPYNPLEQLLGVLPAASARFLPAAYQRLMTDPMSPIIDFYPTAFQIDMNGKKNPWEGIAVIPFADEVHNPFALFFLGGISDDIDVLFLKLFLW